MFNAPFIVLDAFFDLPENLSADLTDCAAQLSDCCGGIPSSDILKGFRVQIRNHSASRLQDEGCTEHRGVQEGFPDLTVIVPGETRTVNAVDDVLHMSVHIFGHSFHSDDFQFVAKIIHRRRIVCAVQGIHYGFGVTFIEFPDLNRSGMQKLTGIRNVKNITQLHAIVSRIQQSNALCTASDIAVHDIIPHIIAGTGRCFRPLRIDQQLIIECVFVEPCRMM